MEKFIALSASKLRINDLAGLTTDTLRITPESPGLLGEVGIIKRHDLERTTSSLVALMDKERASLLTPIIAGHDRERDGLFAEIKRTSSSSAKSTMPNIAEAGKVMVDLLKPFWNINKERLASQTEQIEILRTHYNSSPAAMAAVGTLGLATVMGSLFSVNTSLMLLYDQRLSEMSHTESASASSVKDAVVAAYDEFCVSVEYILSVAPDDNRQALFYSMNDLRRKYIMHVPTRLDPTHTSVAPFAAQAYTGKPVTPLPRVFYQTEKETLELELGKDFSVTYRNNVNVGEAKVIIHGKGKYTGSHETTFYIAR
jgi:hypothetical protein